MIDTGRRLAMTAVVDADGNFVIGIAEEHVPGYVVDKREPTFASFEEAVGRASLLNEKLGLTPHDAFKIVGSSMLSALAMPKGKWTQRG